MIASLTNALSSLHKVMEYEDQMCLGLFLLELKRHEEKLFGQQYNHASSSTKNNHDFFSSLIPTHATQVNQR